MKKTLRLITLLFAAACIPNAFADTMGDVVTMSLVADNGCCPYPAFPAATIGNTSPTFAFADLSQYSGVPAWNWTVNFQGAGNDTLVITAVEDSPLAALHGFQDTFTFTSQNWIMNNATLLSSNFADINGPTGVVGFTGDSVTFSANFGGDTTYQASIQLNETQTQTPEPSAMLMLGAGLLCLGARLKRKFSK